MKDFRDLLVDAKQYDSEAIGELLEMYKPLLYKNSIREGIFDEDLFQELAMCFLHCIMKFNIDV